MQNFPVNDILGYASVSKNSASFPLTFYDIRKVNLSFRDFLSAAGRV